jgi:TPR repeat protein
MGRIQRPLLDQKRGVILDVDPPIISRLVDLMPANFCRGNAWGNGACSSRRSTPAMTSPPRVRRLLRHLQSRCAHTEMKLHSFENLEAAREWYVKGAVFNGRVAMRNLGAMLEDGRGASQNLSEARFLYERAAALEYPPALNDLGRLHLAGAGVPKNYVLARSLFEQAAELGNAEAMNNLGLFYFNGRGVQRNINLARSWFEKAIALNNAEAKENLKRLEEAALLDGTQVAARRMSCLQACGTIHRSYVNSICARYSTTIADGGKPERTKCIDVSLTLAKQCRDSCRAWAPTPLPENKCVTCFQAFIGCSTNQESPDSQGDDRPYAEYSKGCLAALGDCTANCRGQAVPTSGNFNANSEKPN